MSADQQLRWEAENGPRFAVAAFASGAFSLASFLVQALAIGGNAGNEREALIRIDQNQSEFLISLAIQAVAYIGLAAALFYLARATIARRPEGLRLLWPLILFAPLLLTVGGILTQLDLARLADDFVSSGARTNARAEDLLDERSPVSGAVAAGGTLCMAVSYVLVSINAMRAGLLSRFMGILGVIVGALLALPLIPGGAPVVQLFWIVALGVLFLGRWPNGRGPAWDVVEPVPWPTAADTQRARMAAERDPEPRPEPEPAPAGEPDADAHGQRSRTTKRKRKRR